MSIDKTTTDHPATDHDRARPRWACVIRHLGEDLCWACNGWSDFPRASRRTFATLTGATAGWLFGIDDVATQLIELIGT